MSSISVNLNKIKRVVLEESVYTVQPASTVTALFTISHYKPGTELIVKSDGYNGGKPFRYYVSASGIEFNLENLSDTTLNIRVIMLG